MRNGRGLIALYGLALVAVLGCGRESSTEGMQNVYTQLSQREGSHYTAVDQASNVATATAEIAQYDTDVHDLSVRMRESCGCGPDVSMMHDEMGAIHRQMDAIVALVERHAGRTADAATLADLRAECASHHDSMNTMMHDMGAMLGMMSVPAALPTGTADR